MEEQIITTELRERWVEERIKNYRTSLEMGGGEDNNYRTLLERGKATEHY